MYIMIYIDLPCFQDIANPVEYAQEMLGTSVVT